MIREKHFVKIYLFYNFVFVENVYWKYLTDALRFGYKIFGVNYKHKILYFQSSEILSCLT